MRSIATPELAGFSSMGPISSGISSACGLDQSLVKRIAHWPHDFLCAGTQLSTHGRPYDVFGNYFEMLELAFP